jgi:hypothetical protein
MTIKKPGEAVEPASPVPQPTPEPAPAPTPVPEPVVQAGTSPAELIEALSAAYTKGREDARVAAPAPAAAPAEERPLSVMEQLRQELADMPPEKKGPGFHGIGAPNAIPPLQRKTSPQDWTQDDVAQLRARGEFLPRIKAYRNTLPGGTSNLFPAKDRGGKK